MNTDELINLLSELDRGYDYLYSVAQIKQQRNQFKKRASLMKVGAIMCLIIAFLLLAFTIYLMAADGMDEAAGLPSAFSLVIFTIALMLNSEQHAASEQVEYFDERIKNDAPEVNKIQHTIAKLGAYLPQGYNNKDDVSDMLKLLTTGRANTLGEAMGNLDRYRVWRKEEQREKEIYNINKQAADAEAMRSIALGLESIQLTNQISKQRSVNRNLRNRKR